MTDDGDAYEARKAREARILDGPPSPIIVYGVTAIKPGRAMVEEYFDDIEKARRCKRNHILLLYEAHIYEYEIRQHHALLLNLLNRRGCLLFKGVVDE